MKFDIDKGTVPRFLMVMTSVLLVGFGLQHYILSSIFGIPEISWAIRGYAINGALASVIFLGLLKFGKKQINNLGTIFLVASAIKFIFFFVVFRPHFNLDGEITRSEFLSFFIPYILALIVEVYFLVQVLNAIPVDKTKFLDLNDVEEEEGAEKESEKDDIYHEEE